MQDHEISDPVDRIVKAWMANPLGVWTGTEKEKSVEISYLNLLSDTYRRTLREVARYFRAAGRQPSDVHIIEFGTYMGVLSRALAELGFHVTASDMPPLFNNVQLRRLFEKAGVQMHPQDLACSMNSLGDRRFDCAIICETLEHLPFNPVPVLDEINRILKEGGLLYVAVPNIVSVRNRVLLLFGKTIHNPIADFFEQLRPESLMGLGIHWREYTKWELESMISALDFEIQSSNYYDIVGPRCRDGLLRLLKKSLLAAFPSLSSSVVVMGKKVRRSNPRDANKFSNGTLDLVRPRSRSAADSTAMM